jgi:alpha/beta superfamily hydrolase
MVIGFSFGAIIGEFIAMKIYIQHCCTLASIAEHFLSKLHG